MMPILLQYPVAMFGALRVGRGVVNINPQCTATDLAHPLLDAHPVLNPSVITTEVGDLFSLLRGALTNAVIKPVEHLVPAWKIPGSVAFNAALHARQAQALAEVALPHGDIAFLQHTGGTTGVAERWKQATGVAIIESHGLNETSPGVSANALGQFKITDRRKDMIVAPGFKVFPSQIEEIVALNVGVAEVGAIGVADERSGEIVKIVVVRQETALTEHDLLAHCRLHLTGYKMPKWVAFRSEPLPKAKLGKILRRQLREASGHARPQPADPLTTA